MERKMKSMDGNNAAAHVSYAFSEVAAIYPITPSSPMADFVDQWSANGLKNIFGTKVKVVEMQSEAGAAGAVHGSLGAGALTTTYTASQGLLLMIPNMYKIAAEQLPAVFHVSARTVSTQALNIFGDHSDVMACRQTGFAMLCEGNVQEVMDLSPVAHLAALEGKVPFINFFDGFRTSHEIQKIAVWDYEDLKDMCDMDAVKEFRAHALNPEHPHMRGSHENGDIYFQHREACNKYYAALPTVVEKYMDKINAKLGTDYQLFNYYGAPDADRVIVAMGSICDVAEEVIDYLNAHGEKVGLVKVRLFRPFAPEKLVAAIPATAKRVAVLDRTKEPGAMGEPLYQDVVTALANAGKNDVQVIGGRYGLGSKDTPPASVFAVYEELKRDEMKRQFTIGIVDDVTNLSLPEDKNCPNTAAPGTIECKFWGLGGDGTVGANKNSIKIIGDHTDKYVQAYFQYDSKKTGGVTISHLRFGDHPIRSPYYINKADFVACHNPSYITKGYKMVNDVKPGGVFMINCQWDFEELNHHLKADAKRYIARNNIQLYTINAIDLAIEIGMGKRNNTILQSAFFSLAKVLPEEDAIRFMKEKAKASYLKKGQDVVDMNYKAIDLGATAYKKIDVPAEWADAVDEPDTRELKGKPELVKMVKEILEPVGKMDGDSLPVSAFTEHVDGQFELGASAYEKRGVAVSVPTWDANKCIQCNQCAYVCPHAVIRPFLATDEEAAAYQVAINNSSNVYQRVYNMQNNLGRLMAGDVMFEDRDGSGSIGTGAGTGDDPGDMMIIGNTTPRYSYSFRIEASWNGFDISAFFQGVGKRDWYPTANKDDIYGANQFWQLYGYTIPSFITYDFMDDVWSEQNPGGYFPRLRPIQSYNGGPLGQNNDRYLQSVAYLRFKNLTIGYTLPVLKKYLSKLRIYVSGENLCYWSPLKKHCKLIDPELAISSGTYKGGTGTGYTMPRTFSFGVDITF